MKSFLKLKKNKSKGGFHASDNYRGQSVRISDVLGDGVVDEEHAEWLKQNDRYNPYQPYQGPPPVFEQEAKEMPDFQKDEILNQTMETDEDEQPVEEHVVSDCSFTYNQGTTLYADPPLAEDLFANNPFEKEEKVAVPAWEFNAFQQDGKQTLSSAPSASKVDLLQLAEDENNATAKIAQPVKEDSNNQVRISVKESISQDKQKAMDEIDDLVDEYNKGIADLDAMDHLSSSSDDESSDDDSEDYLPRDLLDEFIRELNETSSDSEFSSAEEEEDDEELDRQKRQKVLAPPTAPSKASMDKEAAMMSPSEEEKKEDEAQVDKNQPAVVEIEGTSSDSAPEVSGVVDDSFDTTQSGVSGTGFSSTPVQNEGLFGGMSLRQMFWDEFDEDAVGEDDVDTDESSSADDVRDGASEAKSVLSKFGFEATFGPIPNEGSPSDGHNPDSQDTSFESILLLDRFAGTIVEPQEPGKVDPRATAVRKQNRPFPDPKPSASKKNEVARKESKVKFAKSLSPKKARTSSEVKPTVELVKSHETVGAEQAPSSEPDIEVSLRTEAAKLKEARTSSEVKPTVQKSPEKVGAEPKPSSEPDIEVSLRTSATKPQPPATEKPKGEAASAAQTETSISPSVAVAVASATEQATQVPPKEPQAPEIPAESTAPETQANEMPATTENAKTVVEKPPEKESEFAIFSAMMQDVYQFTFGHFVSPKKASTTEASKSEETTAPGTNTPTDIEPGTTDTFSETSQSPTAAEQDIQDQGYEVRPGQAADEIHEVASGKGFDFSRQIHTILRTNKGKKSQTSTSKLTSLFGRKKSVKSNKL